MDKTNLLELDNITMTNINIKGPKYTKLGVSECKNCFLISNYGSDKSMENGEWVWLIIAWLLSEMIWKYVGMY